MNLKMLMLMILSGTVPSAFAYIFYVEGVGKVVIMKQNLLKMTTWPHQKWYKITPSNNDSNISVRGGLLFIDKKLI